MLNNLKALVVVLALALLVFRVVRPLCVRFMSEEALKLRRNAWFALTLAAFLSPTFWIFALFEIALLIWLSRKDENPLALFAVVTFIIPNVAFFIPAVLVNQLFDLTQYRIIALALLIPAIVRMYGRRSEWKPKSFGLVDTLLLGFILIQIVMAMPYESFTNTLRRTFLILLDTYLVAYAFQRLSSKKRLVEMLACFWLSTAIMAPMAIFESVKGWLLYTGLRDVWGDPSYFVYLFRGNSLRAQVAAGHSINLGYQLAAGLGSFLYLWRPDVSRRLGWSIVAVFAAALVATGSRGAWVTAMISVVLYVGFRPHAGRRLAGAAFVTVMALGLMYFSPLKETILDRLPIIGVTDQDTIEYRQQLFDVSWQLIQQNPFFGDPFVTNHMESLRQGQGIIDIVNGYIFVALFYGLVALAFLVGSFLVSLARCLQAVFVLRRTEDEDLTTLGVVLFAVFAAGMFYMGTGGIITTHYIFLGLLGSYWRIARQTGRQYAPAFRGQARMNIKPIGSV